MPLEALRPFAAQNSQSYPVQLVLGKKLREAGDLDEAVRAFERAAALVPIATGPESPNVQIAQIALQRKDPARAIAALPAVTAADFDNIHVARQLAKLMREGNIPDPAGFVRFTPASSPSDPFDPMRMGCSDASPPARRCGDRDPRIPDCRRPRPVDHSAAYTDLAESYFQGGRRAEARKQTLAALEIAPSYEAGAESAPEAAETGHDARRVAARRSCRGFDPDARTGVAPPADAHCRTRPMTDSLPAWRFVRIKYHYVVEGTSVQQDFYGEPWYIDAPAAEQNLSRRLKSATSIQVEDPIVLGLDDPRLFSYPWIYMVEPGNLKFTDEDVATLREFLLRGGTLTFDDFHGPIEWDHMAAEMKRVFPDRDIVEVPKDHPVYSSFYRIDGYPQIAGLGSFFAGRTWEKGGYIGTSHDPDDTGRRGGLNWNTDMGDGWEWSNAGIPRYIGTPRWRTGWDQRDRSR